MAEIKYLAIEELKLQENTPDAVFEGVKAANGWKTGKQVTEKNYKEAVETFNKAPMDGREVKK
jgi:hypothetical protein